MAEPSEPGTARHGALLALGTSAVLAAVLGLQLPAPTRLLAYLQWAPLCSALQLAALVLLLAASLRSTATDRRKAMPVLVDLGLAIALTLLLAWSVPATLRVESDESNLLATSYGLLHTGEPEAYQTGIYDSAGVLAPRTAVVDKRGLLFPMLLVPLHRVLGFDPYNGARLNLIACVLCLWFLIALARPFAGTWAARAAPFMLTATPAYALAVRSGGFDVVNLAALLGLLLAVRTCVERPSASRAWIAVLAAAVLAQIRYESILPALAAIVMLGLAFLRAAPQRAASPWRWAPLIAAPLLLLPALWRQAVPIDLEMLQPGMEAFSLANAGTNLAGLLAWLFVPDRGHQGMPLLGWLALLAVIQHASGLLRGTKPPRMGDWWPMVAALAACLFITLAYWWGQAMLAATARLFLPWAALLAVVGAHGLAMLGPRLGKALTLLLPAAALAWGIPVAASGDDLIEMKEALRLAAIESALNEGAPGCRVLVLDNRSGGFVVRGWSSLTPGDARARWAELEGAMQGGAFDRIAATEPRPDFPPAPAESHWNPSASRPGGPVLWWWNSEPGRACDGSRPAPSGIDAAARMAALRQYSR